MNSIALQTMWQAIRESEIYERVRRQGAVVQGGDVVSVLDSAITHLTGGLPVSTGNAAHEIAAQATMIPGPRVTLPSLGLRVSERRLMLFMVDVVLVNLALLGTAILFTDQIRSLSLAGDNIKWFMTLSVVWFATASFFDCYNLARAASTWASVRNTAFAAACAVGVYAVIPVLSMPLVSRGSIFFQLGVTISLVMIWRAVYARVFVQPWSQQRAKPIAPWRRH